MQVKSPTSSLSNAGTMFRRKSVPTSTSLSLITKNSLEQAEIILSSENTFALGHDGWPEKTMVDFTWEYRLRRSSTTATSELFGERAPNTIYKLGTSC